MTDATPCKIVVVDDDAAVRDSLDALLTARGYACAHFADADNFLTANDAADPAIVLMDYSLGETSGLQAIRHVRGGGDTRPIIMITAHGDIELAVEAMRAGASDFIEKPWDKNALFDAIERASAHVRSAADRAKNRQHAIDAIDSFTPRERDVFNQLITGASNKMVARALDLSPRTVEFYRAKIFEKSEAASVAELVRLAFMARGATL